jgi:hypothetical protein
MPQAQEADVGADQPTKRRYDERESSLDGE